MTGLPSAGATLRTMAGVTWTRLRRGKALWIGAAICALPSLFAYAMVGRRGSVSPGALLYATTPLLVLLPPLFVASSVSEELESKTSTYLWSRPIARWAAIAGKLCTLVPIATLLVLAGWLVAVELGTHAPPPAISFVALAAGCVAISLVVSAIAVLVPKHGMALAIGYLLIDSFLGAIPFSLAELALTHQARVLTHLDGLGPWEPMTPAIAMVAVTAVWTAIGLAKLRKLEV